MGSPQKDIRDKSGSKDQQAKAGPGWEGKVAAPQLSGAGNSPASMTILAQMGCLALLGLGSSSQLILL